jgi:hypothetical protein
MWFFVKPVVPSLERPLFSSNFRQTDRCSLTEVDWDQKASATDQKASTTFHTKNSKCPQKATFLTLCMGDWKGNSDQSLIATMASPPLLSYTCILHNAHWIYYLFFLQLEYAKEEMVFNSKFMFLIRTKAYFVTTMNFFLYYTVIQNFI